MDQEALVTEGISLVRILDEANTPPRAAMLVYSSDTDTWKLWIVPDKSLRDKREFYSRIAEIISHNREAFQNLDAGDIELAADDHPGIVGLSKMMKATGISRIRLENNMYNGVYLPDGTLLRMDL